MEKILIIDGSSLFFRAFYALPLLKTKKGIYTNALYGFIQMVENAIDRVKPTHAVVCFDMKGKTFRSEIYKEYKGTRQKTPNELEQQFPIVRDVLNLMNIVVLESPVYEADDIAGTISKMASEMGMESVLLTGDKDYYQLVGENTSVLLTRKGITEMDLVTVESLNEDYGITPDQFIDLKGLMGDNSDNIPGVPGIGEKTGLKLIHEFGTIENLYDNIDKITAKKQKEKLEDNKAQAFMSKKLGTIVRNVPIETEIKDLEIQQYNLEELSDLYREYEFYTLLKRLPEEFQKAEIVEVSESAFEVRNVEPKELVEEIKKEKSFAFRFITDGKIYEGIEPCKFAIKVSENPTVVYSEIDKLLDFKEVFESEDIEKLGHDLNEDIMVLMSKGIDIKNFTHDTQIAEYLLNSTKSDYDISNITNEHFRVGYKDEEELLGKGVKKKKYSDLSEDEINKYAAFYLTSVYKLRDRQVELLKEQEMEELYRNVELPLVEVLASMELIGIKTETTVFDEIGFDLDLRIEKLESLIYEQAGEKFNISSPKQLGVILFEKLGFQVIKKTKTGYSTSAEVLEKLIDEGKIVGNILEYRKLTKLKSTYVDGLKAIVNKKTGRIHSHFNQTVASTGRISSQDPNLQNIPIKTEEGRLIRKAFLASDGCSLVDADYSQIELRVLASITEDENMISAFEQNVDIHRKTASEVLEVPLEEVSPLLRSQAKAVNFGIVYGISDYGLSRNLNIPRKTAKTYIDNYLENFKGIRKFMTDEVEVARKNGYVKTILNRRRYIPELSAKNFNIRQFGERIAINTPIQGSAADIIKIAMVRVYKTLKEKNMASKLILQIHDELIVDAVEEEVEDVKKLMHELMENAVKMKVDLKIDMQVGESLYDTK
ncbi:DNA polymerase I [Peptoniphilus asaccharolyticus DSM 20463]|uniref:DNA polymerase I n=1 Tax=Peptoniphilus asaccharolyticus DSM 20463 TaxID=573058 RepID=A0A1W1VB05_PEPAS|nr:DNA polymerase I [Peptoniphilus asaccharolyticus]MBL7575709.1 DNA polymerase I [Peptoniphilus asaccharolyticus]SMB90403.1 DNA polymerase I [Peptoniphilus asaccharolyticus DSM 20463]